MIISGDYGYGLLAAYIGGPAAQASLIQRSAATWRRFCINHVNRVNSHNGSAMMTAL